MKDIWSLCLLQLMILSCSIKRNEIYFLYILRYSETTENVMSRKTNLLSISKRPLPKCPAWLDEERYLLEAGINSQKTMSGYRSALRLFADWLQYFRKGIYSIVDPWPLSAEHLDTKLVLDFRYWLLKNRAEATVVAYMAGVMGYLHFLDGRDLLPQAVQLQKLQHQLARRPIRRNQAEEVVNFDLVRQDIPKIIAYYNNLPLPLKEDSFNRRITLLRDRALVNVLYSTAARISEVVKLNRSSIRSDNHSAFAMVTGKGNKGRTLHIRDYALIPIKDYLGERKDNNPALFVSHSRNARNQRLNIRSVHDVVKRAVRELGLDESLSAHDFRHYRAVQLLRNGVRLEVVQELLGHADIGTTRRIYAPVLGANIVAEWLDKTEQTPQEALMNRSLRPEVKGRQDVYSDQGSILDLPF